MNRIFSGKRYGAYVLVLISLIFASCSKDTAELLEEGKTAFYAAEYVKAKNAFLECSNRGDSQGQFWLAVLTNQVNGHYSETDTLKMSEDEIQKYTFDLYKKSAEQNDGDGYYGLFTCYLHGKGVVANMKEAQKCLDKSVELNSYWGYATKGRVLVTGELGEKDVNKGIEYIKKSADAKNYLGITTLGEFLVAGLGIEKDVNRGMNLLKEASEHNMVIANDVLARAYFYGDCGERNSSLAFNYAKNGTNIDATIYILAVCYYYGEGVEQNSNLGVKLARMASRTDYAPAIRFWGDICEDGYGTKIEAFEYYMKAAELGNTYATAKVGEYLLLGTIGKTDYSLAKKCLMKAASEGSDNAQKLLSTYSGFLQYY